MGSEMCIRDRLCALRANARDPREIDGAHPAGDEFLADLALLGYCLLYTSDAADDLLCVDLGGRRIIKKKNNQLHVRDYVSK